MAHVHQLQQRVAQQAYAVVPVQLVVVLEQLVVHMLLEQPVLHSLLLQNLHGLLMVIMVLFHTEQMYSMQRMHRSQQDVTSIIYYSSQQFCIRS